MKGFVMILTVAAVFVAFAVRAAAVDIDRPEGIVRSAGGAAVVLTYSRGHYNYRRYPRYHYYRRYPSYQRYPYYGGYRGYPHYRYYGYGRYPYYGHGYGYHYRYHRPC